MQHPETTPPAQPPVALITGGARRIGHALCCALHKHGYNIIVHYHRSAQAAQTLADTLNQQRPNSAAAVRGNLNIMDDVEGLARKAYALFGRLDALINNASSFYPTPLSTATEGQWLDLINSNLKAPYFLIQALAPALRQSGGSIINMADIYSLRPMPQHSIYSIAKAGNRMMTMALAQELAPDIRVNGIAPGAILWPEDANGDAQPNPSKLDAIPLKSLGGTEAITQAALYLLTSAPYTTGQILSIDGGKSLNL